MLNRIGCGVSFALLCAMFVASPALADENSKTAGKSTTLSQIANKMPVGQSMSSIDEEPAHSAKTAEKAGVLKQYEPKTTSRITSLSTLDRKGTAAASSNPQVASSSKDSRGYSAWRKASSSKSQVASSKNNLPQHAPPKRASDAGNQTAAKSAAPAEKAAPAKPAVKAAPVAKNPAPAAPARKAGPSKAAPSAAAAKVPASTPAKSVKAATAKPDSAPAKQAVAAPATPTTSSKISSSNSSGATSRSWRSRVFGSSGKTTVTDTTEKTTVAAAASTTAKPAPAKAPAAAPKATEPVQTAATASSKPAAKPVSAATSTAPSPVVVANERTGANKGGSGKALQPTVTENPPAGGSLIARGSKNGAPNIMRVLTGKSIMVDLAKDSKRVAVADPKIAEVLIITPKQIMVNGLSDGETSIIIWDRAGNYTMSSVVVGDDLADQVMLEVTVAEINRSAMERHGVDYRNFGGQFNSISQYGGAAPVSGSFPPSQSDPPFPISLDGGISWAIVDTKNDIALIFKQLQDDNLGRILAEPKLLSRSGKEANFLSGGEIPIVITTNDDTSIEFKEFGTKVDFTPAVREDGTIDLALQAEVSEPDFSAGIELFGFTVPAFVTRRSHTEVTLRDEQSLIVAGLIKETKQELESKMPFVGDIPVLGYFFRRTEYTNDILELIMVVKPRLVHPIAAGTRVALPTDRGPLTKQEVRTGPVEEKVSRPRPY